MEKIMELSVVRQGEVFLFGGEKFVKLDDDVGASFVVRLDILQESCAFEDDDSECKDHNNFVGSNLQNIIDQWLLDRPNINKVVVDRPIDLTSMDGMTDYGKPIVHGRALTIDEYRKYRRFIPLTSDWYWLATPWCTLRSPDSSNYYYAYVVNTSGASYGYDVYSATYCPRPALYLDSSIFVSVETEEGSKSLRDYTDTELLDELLRRRTEKTV